MRGALLSLLLLLTLSLGAQQPSAAGVWEGFLATPDGDLSIRVEFRQETNDRWIGALAASAGKPFPLTDVKVQNNKISFTLVTTGAMAFEGEMVEARNIAGNASRDGMLFPFRLARNGAALQAGSEPEKPITMEDIAGSLDERPFFASRRHPAIEYGSAPASDRVAALAQRVADGSVKLKFESSNGYLKSVLDALKLPVESQAIVFSRTSVQGQYIAPNTPRALYFSDDVTLGFIQDAPFLEFAAQDPQQGTIFYTLDQQEVARPEIRRRDNCLSCHESRNSLDVPGLLVRSVGVTGQGDLRPQLANYVSDHRSPFEERWSGWYVTGKTDVLRHLGVSAESLKTRFDPVAYPSASSDVAALMVFDHQVRMTNLLTRVAWEVRTALYEEEKTGKGKDVIERLIANNAKELVDYLLFVDEARIPGKIQSTSGFAEVFGALGPRDSQGRSLRQLDLGKRLMRYPCSYMIYSAAFDGLPSVAKEAVYKRMWEVLSGKFASADREAIIQILRETKRDLPSYFR